MSASGISQISKGNIRQRIQANLKLKVQVSADSVLRLLSPTMRHTVGRQLQYIQMLQQRPVLLVAPFDVTIR